LSNKPNIIENDEGKFSEKMDIFLEPKLNITNTNKDIQEIKTNKENNYIVENFKGKFNL
jgi:hypothetical protein